MGRWGFFDGFRWDSGWSIAGYEKTAWEQAGVQSSAELKEWLNAGLPNPTAVRVWKSKGFDSRTSLRWIELGWSAGEAAQWFRRFSPDTATVWRSHNCSPNEAQELHHKGVNPWEIDLWSRIGVASLHGIGSWTSRSFDHKQAKSWIDVGLLDAGEAAAWRDAKCDARVWTRWTNADIDSSVALQLIASGIKLKEARSLRSIGAESAEIHSWLELDLSRRQIGRWISIGASSAEAQEWALRGGWRVFSRWASGRRSIRELLGRSTAWFDAGINLADAVEWNALGQTASSAKQWSSRGIGPFSAFRWMTAGIDDPAAVEFWHRLELEPEEVRRWCNSVGHDAQFWYQATGGDLKLVHAWRSSGVRDANQVLDFVRVIAETSPTEDAVGVCRDFQAAGIVGLEEAREWIDKFGPTVSIQWLNAGVDSVRNATSWSNAGFEPLTAIPWVALNESPEICAKWRDAFEQDIEQSAEWLSIGVSGPEAALRYLSLGLSPSQVSQWSSLGITSAGEMSAWNSRWSLSEAIEWTEALAASVEEAWTWRALVEGSLRIAVGMSDRGLSTQDLRAWIAERFTFVEIWSWLDCGCRSPALASSFLDNDVTRREVSAWAALGIDTPKILSIRETLTLDEAVQWNKVLGSLDKYEEWRDVVSDDLQLVNEWIAAGIDSPIDVHEYSSHGINPEEARLWRSAGVEEPFQASLWSTRCSARNASEWVQSLGSPMEVAFEWMETADGDLRLALIYRELDLLPVQVSKWIHNGFDHHEVKSWISVGCTSVDLASEFRALGIPSQEVQKWNVLGIPPQSVRNFREQIELDEAQHWFRILGCLDDAPLWRSIVSSDDAARLIAAGVPSAEETQRWFAEGFSVDSMIAWWSTSLAAPVARQWFVHDFTPEDATDWFRVSPDPESANSWRSVCPKGSGEALVWLESSVDSPERVIELRTIGLDALGHKALRDRHHSNKAYRRALRLHAARYFGFEVADESDSTLVVQLSDDHAEIDPDCLSRLLRSAGSSKGWNRLRVIHGSPRLSERAIVLLREARFVRGGAKASVVRFAHDNDGLGFSMSQSGEFSEFDVKRLPRQTEFLTQAAFGEP